MVEATSETVVRPVNSNDALLFVLAGQSNMVGTGDLQTLPARYAAELSEVKIRVDGSFPPAQIGRFENLKPGYGGAFGPELSLGHELLKLYPGRPIYLLKVAYPGTYLAAFNMQGVPAGMHWHPQEGLLYKMLLTDVSDSLQKLRNIHPTATLKALFWMQGESDSLNEEFAESYADNIIVFINTLRAQWGVPKLPFIVGLVSAIPVWKFNRTVRAAQTALQDRWFPDSARVVETTDLKRWEQGEGAHYNTEGLLELGNRYAKAYAGLPH